MLLDYLNYFSDAKVHFYSSDMKLYADLDAAYLVAPKAKSRIAGYFYCSSNNSPPPITGPLHVEYKVLQHVVTSPLQKPKRLVYFLIAKRHCTSSTCCQHWAILKTQSNTSAVSHGMYGTIGLLKNNLRDSSTFTGIEVPIIWWTITPSTIAPLITKM